MSQHKKNSLKLVVYFICLLVIVCRCLSYLPGAVGKNPAHFDLGLARDQSTNGRASGEWLVLHIQELIALAYQVLDVKLFVLYWFDISAPGYVKVDFLFLILS